jgi:7 transmembrane helices usually fused to an inactive transglutaminase
VAVLQIGVSANSKLLLAVLFLVPLAMVIGRQPFLPSASFLEACFSLTYLSEQLRAVVENVLVVPLGALVVVIVRLTLGLRMLGFFRPILLAIAFNIIGIPISAAFLIGVLTFIVLLRPFLRADHNYARLAVMLSIVATLLFIPLIAGNWLQVAWLMKLADFPVIALCLTCESFAKVLDRHGIGEAIWRTLITLAAAAVITALTSLSGVLDLFLHFPELLMAQAGCIILIGKHLNIRLFESTKPLALKPVRPSAVDLEDEPAPERHARAISADFDTLQSRYSGIAGLFPAPSNLNARSRTIEVAGTSPATTLDKGQMPRPDRKPV